MSLYFSIGVYSKINEEKRPIKKTGQAFLTKNSFISLRFKVASLPYIAQTEL